MPSFDPIAPSYFAVTPASVNDIPYESKVCSANIPKALTSLNRFSVWKPAYDETDQTKIKKQPFDKNGNLCKWTELTNLMSYDEAYHILSTHPEYGGIQFALFKMDGICSIDFDNVIDNDGRISSKTLSELETLGYPYTEYSPSIKGLRVFFYGTLPKAQYHKEGLPEFYSDKKLLTVTGHHLPGTNSEIIPIQSTNLMQVLRSYYPTDALERGPDDIPRTSETFTDEQVINKVLSSKIGNDFRSAYIEGTDIKDNDNETDFYAINKIAFYAQDIPQIYRLMQDSALKRKKWIESRDIKEPWGSYIDELDLPRNYLTLTITSVLTRLDKVFKQAGSVELYRKYDNYYCNSTGVYIKEYKRKPVEDTESGKTKYDIVLEDTLLCATPVYISSTGYNPRTGKFYVKLTYINYAGDEKTQWVQPEALTIKNKLQTLANEIAITDDSAGRLTEYFKKAILGTAKEPQETVYSSIGYQDNNSCYILGDRKITADKIETIVPLEMNLAEKLTKAGTLEGYVEAGKTLMQFPVLRVKFYGMMSSLLLDLVYGRNITITHVATSGNLKGDSSYWNMGAFGHPVMLQLNPSSSHIGFQGHMALMEGLPTSVEELTGHPEILKQIQYHTTSGVTRTLGKRDSGIRGGALLRSVLCANSETPIFSSKDRLGNNIRNLNLEEIIETVLSNEEIIELEELINNNYGWAAELLIQIILQEKDNLKTLMIAFEAGLSEVSGIPENRFKNMCAFIALSGFLCEKLFTKIGIPNEDPTKLVDRFMLQNLEKGITEPLYKKALKVLAEHFIIYKNDFKEAEPGEKETSHRRGFLERNSLAFLPSELETVLNKELGAGQAGAALVEFEIHNCIKTRAKGKRKTDHGGISVYKITKEALKEHVGIDIDAKFEDEDEINNPSTDPAEGAAPATAVVKDETAVSTPTEKAANNDIVNDTPSFIEGEIDSNAYFSAQGGSADA